MASWRRSKRQWNRRTRSPNRASRSPAAASAISSRSSPSTARCGHRSSSSSLWPPPPTVASSTQPAGTVANSGGDLGGHHREVVERPVIAHHRRCVVRSICSPPANGCRRDVSPVRRDGSGRSRGCPSCGPEDCRWANGSDDSCSSVNSLPCSFRREVRWFVKSVDVVSSRRSRRGSAMSSLPSASSRAYRAGAQISSGRSCR